MSSSAATIVLGVGGWLGAFYSAGRFMDGMPFDIEKTANIISGPLVGGLLTHAIFAGLLSVPGSASRVYLSMFAPVPLTFFAVVCIVYVFAVLGFRAFYEMQVKTAAQLAVDEQAEDAAAAAPLPESDSDSESEGESDGERESEAAEESEGESEGESESEAAEESEGESGAAEESVAEKSDTSDELNTSPVQKSPDEVSTFVETHKATSGVGFNDE